MIKRFLTILLFLSLFGLRSFPQKLPDDIILRDKVSQYGQVEVTIPYTGIRDIDNLTKRVSIISVRDKLVYISLSPLTVEWFIMQQFYYSIVEMDDSKGIVSALSVKLCIMESYCE